MELNFFITLIIIIGIFVIGSLAFLVRCFKKAEQGKSLIRTGLGREKVSFSGMIVMPVIHRLESMDITVKRIEIERRGKEGLICKDNMRADIKVAFFVRVNQTAEDVRRVAQSLGCNRASDRAALIELFDAKFSEALKTVGKKFNFVDLYNSRDLFKGEIIQIIGTDLNGYVLDDAAIDFLEQTDVDSLSPDNILDSEGIKKITELTATQAILANKIQREREKTIKQQDVEADEAKLELDRQLAESMEKQKREIALIKAREMAETVKVQQEERQRAEQARIIAEEEIKVAEENKDRQIIVAAKNKQRTEQVESERIEKDRQLEAVERERVVQLANIEKERAIEEKRKEIQDVIRERVVVEKAVVQEEEKIKDTRAIAEAERNKTVAVTNAQREAEELLIKEVKSAEAKKRSAELAAEEKQITADADLKASSKHAEARKTIAEARAAEDAVVGMAEVQVMEAKAHAIQVQGAANAKVLEDKATAEAKAIELNATANLKKGEAEADVMRHKAGAQAHATEVQGAANAKVLEDKATAEAKAIELNAAANIKRGESEADVMRHKAAAEAHAIELNASANLKKGEAEADVMRSKAVAEASGIREKAEAMKQLDGVGREHEEFKLRLAKDKEIELAGIDIQRDIAAAQARVIEAALRSAKIDIVGGETMFFEKIMGAITRGKSMDRLVEGSQVLTDVKNTFFTGNPDDFQANLKQLIGRFGMSSEDVKNLTISAALAKMMAADGNAGDKSLLRTAMATVEKLGLGDKPVSGLL